MMNIAVTIVRERDLAVVRFRKCTIDYHKHIFDAPRALKIQVRHLLVQAPGSVGEIDVPDATQGIFQDFSLVFV